MNLKHSFDPIVTEKSHVLILGSMPGDKSIEVHQYYGHWRNRFWKIIAFLSKRDLPSSYPEKIDMLLASGVGLWDVVKQAERKGSLDSDIKHEEPNNIAALLIQNPQIKTIGFNGKKAQKLYDKYFDRNPEIQYLELPSTSPANARFNFEKLLKYWRQIKA